MFSAITMLMRAGVVGALGVLGAAEYYQLSLNESVAEAEECYRVIGVEEGVNSEFLSEVPRKVGVIGGGFTGMVACKTIVQQGYDCELLESKPGLGGVWYENYDKLTLQGPFIHYVIPDFLPKGDLLEYPGTSEVREYLNSYAEHFGLLKYCSFNSPVSGIRQREDFKWIVSLGNGEEKVYDFLVIANGRSHTPYLPRTPSMDVYKGKICHSSQVRDSEELFKGKRVIVVGGNKSAWDMVRLASASANNVTWVKRSSVYSFSPSDTILGYPNVQFLYSRMGAYFIHPKSKEDEFWPYEPFRQLFFYLLKKEEEKNVPQELRCSRDLQRTLPVHGLFMRDPTVIELVKSQKVRVIKGEISEFRSHTVQVNGEQLNADIIVFATGFSKDFYGFEGQVLYRNMIIPKVKNLAILGMLHYGSTPVYANIQALWLVNVFAGKIKLPSGAEMTRLGTEFVQKLAAVYGDSPDLQHGLTTYGLVDKLLLDMNINIYRKGTGFGNYIDYFNPLDYESVIKYYK